ncbi:hypothetical protein QCN27_17785 [Cereibacter sp. SYSU M97828]|nr:hypothetical protein [Cereibacter flavus]
MDFKIIHSLCGDRNLTVDYLFVGFSVTEQGEGYFPAARKRLEERGDSCDVVSIGGATFQELAHLSELINFDAKYVIFEVSTCRRLNKERSVEDYLSFLCHRAARAGAIPCFFNIPRSGYIKPDDDLDYKFWNFARKHGFPYYSMYQEMSRIDRLGVLSTYLRDGTHTTATGSELYADHAVKFIDGLRNTYGCSGFEFHPVDGKWPVIIEVNDILLDVEVESFSRKGLSLPVISIPEGNAVDFRIPRDCAIESIAVILGPKTGDFEIRGHSEPEVIRAYDKDCHYRRIAFIRCPPNDGLISIRQLQGRPDIELTKQNPDHGPRLGQVAGFLTFQ